MLKSHETNTEKTPAAGGNRVTPTELSSALAAIEARRQRDAGMIGINDAVSELDLNAAPEEIWVEVEAQRTAAADAQREQARQEQARREQAIKQKQQAKQRLATLLASRRGWTAFIAPLVLLWALSQTHVIPHFWNHPTHTAAPVLRSLAQIPDGKEVYADDAALVQISEGKPLKQITVSENMTGNRWTMVKIGAHVYLRGYIASTDSLLPLAGKALNVYNDDNSGELEGEKTSNITLRVDDVPLQKSSGDDGFSEVTIPGFQPDPLTTLSPWH